MAQTAIENEASHLSFDRPKRPGRAVGLCDIDFRPPADFVLAPPGPDPETDPAPRTLPEPEPKWEALRPEGVYARWGRPLLSAALLILTLPPALVLGALIALLNWVQFGDLRQIFFLQLRRGLRGRPFHLIKFRTMAEGPAGDFEAWSGGEDRTRVTAFGQFLRNSHLDELPQLINVLRGEMDFIGPRPEMLEVEAWAAANVPGFVERLAIKPGITGRAQITQGYTGRDVEAYARKLRINLEYQRALSLRGDLGIVLRTAVWMLCGRGWGWKGR